MSTAYFCIAFLCNVFFVCLAFLCSKRLFFLAFFYAFSGLLLPHGEVLMVDFEARAA